MDGLGCHGSTDYLLERILSRGVYDLADREGGNRGRATTVSGMNRSSETLRARLHEIIFEADTPEGRLFDLLLMLAIGSSVVVVLLESVASVRDQAGTTLRALEWGFTILFTLEYVLRLATVRRPLRYARSTLG